MDYLLVGVGGFLGANLRYVVSTWIAGRVGAEFPTGTMVINVTGSIVIGFLMVLLTERLLANPLWRLLLVTGFLGGYTTFSSYTYETLGLLESGDWLRAAFYFFGSSGIGLLAVFLGVMAGRALGG